MKKLIFSVIVTILVMMLSTITWAVTVDQVKFGVTVSNSGVWANYGELHTKAWAAAENAINELGGIYIPELGKKLPVKIIVYDDTSDSTQAVRMYEKLMTVDKVNALFGPFGSPLTMAITTVAEKHKVPLMALNASNYMVFGRGLNYLWGTQQTSFDYGRTPLRCLKDLMDEGKIPEKKLTYGLIYDTTEWEPHVRGFKSAVAMAEFKDSFELAVEVPYELGASSFNAIIDKLRAANPDVLLGFATYSDITGIIKYMKMGKFRPKFVFLFDANLPELITGFNELVEGITSYWDWPVISDDTTPLYTKFREYFLAQGWGEPSIVYQTGLLAGAEVLVKAIETVGLDSEKIKNYIDANEFSTCVGTMKFGNMDVLGTELQGVNLLAGGNVFQVQDGEYVQIWPTKYATGKLQYPLSPDF